MSPSRRTRSAFTVKQLISLGEFEPAERLLLAKLVEAEATSRLSLVAECHANLGHVAEAQGRVGDAVRHWSMALYHIGAVGLQNSAESLRLSRLIRQWHKIPRIWISYAHGDSAQVTRIIRRLRRRRIEVRTDKDFLAGREIERQIRRAISECPKYVIIWSQKALDRPWIQFELQMLRDQRNTDIQKHAFDNSIIFYCLDNTPIPDEHRDDLQVLEHQLGINQAVKALAHSISKSDLQSVPDAKD